MPLWANFVGPAYQTQAKSIAADACINIFLESTRNAADPKKATFYGTPGQVEYRPGNIGLLLPEVNCRGLFSQEGRAWGVNGATFYEFVAGPPPTVMNTHAVANDGLLVTFACNGLGGNQLAVCASGVLYILNLATAVWTVVTLPFVPVMVKFMDGYFLANEKNTPKVWFSNLFNGLTWSATDFFTRSSTSDNVTGIEVNNRRVYAIGSKTTEIFQDSGDATTPFIPYPGTVINEGTNSYQSITSIADTVFWAGSTKEFGSAQVFAVAGLQPRVISTSAISFYISQSTNAAEAEVLSYTQRGHVFICWTWPSLATTWVYDLTEDAWHQRVNYVETPPGSGTFAIARWQARACCAFFPAFLPQPAVLVGQVDTRFLCQLSLEANTDQTNAAGVTNLIVRQRIAPYLSAENQWLFLQQVELGIEHRAGALVANDMQLLLSDDNAASFGPSLPAASLSMDGQAVAQWFQLGRHRADRFVLAVTQRVDKPCVWGPGLYLRATPGTGQL